MLGRRTAAAIVALGWIGIAHLSAASSAAVREGLDEEESRRLGRGEVVVRTRPTGDFPWPEVTTWRRVAGTPAAVMAVYADFDRHTTWVPKLMVSRVVARGAPNVFRVFYEYDSAGPNEKYTVTVTLGRTALATRVERLATVEPETLSRLVHALLAATGGGS